MTYSNKQGWEAQNASLRHASREHICVNFWDNSFPLKALAYGTFNFFVTTWRHLVCYRLSYGSEEELAPWTQTVSEKMLGTEQATQQSKP